MSGLMGQSTTETDVLKHLVDHPEGRTTKDVATYLGRSPMDARHALNALHRHSKVWAVKSEKPGRPHMWFAVERPFEVPPAKPMPEMPTQVSWSEPHAEPVARFSKPRVLAAVVACCIVFWVGVLYWIFS